MCGLITFLGRPETKNANNIMLDQYERQAGRGKQGFGLVEIDKQSFNIKRSMGEARAIHDISLSQAKIMMFHHRYPTSTINVHEQTHPLFISNEELKYDWLIMHNGVISNDDELKKAHESIGYVYLTEIIETYAASKMEWVRFNDSEAFAIELARYLESKSDIINIHGSAAFTALKIDKKTNKPISIIVGRNDKNPLDMELREDGILIASEIPGDKKVEIPAFTALEVKISELTAKKTFGKLKGLMPLNFAVAPIAEQRTMGFGAGGWSGKHYQDTKDYDFAHGRTIYDKKAEEVGVNDVAETCVVVDNERMEAFDKMQGRIEEDISEQLSMLFAELSYEDIDDLGMNEYVMRVEDILMDAKTRATKAREFFDSQDLLDQEIEDYKNSGTIQSYDPDYSKVPD